MIITKNGAKIAVEKQKKEPIVTLDATRDATNVSTKKEEMTSFEERFIVFAKRKVRIHMANPTRYHFWWGKGHSKRLFGFWQEVGTTSFGKVVVSIFC